MKNKTILLLNIFSWVVLLFSIICNYSVFTYETHKLLLCSDAVSVQFLYDDLFAGPGKLKDFYFPTSPSLFPDLTLYAIVQLLHFKYTISIVIYAIIQMVIICALSIFIFKQSVPSRLKPYS